MASDDVNVLLDEQRIRNVIIRYFTGLDRKDPKLFEDVFTEDAVMTALAGERRFEGRQEIIKSLMTVAGYDHTSHYPTSQIITVTGDAATGDTFGIAVIALSKPRSLVMVRGLQYLDRFVRTPSGWRIAERQHIPTWQYEMDGKAPQLPA